VRRVLFAAILIVLASFGVANAFCATDKFVKAPEPDKSTYVNVSGPIKKSKLAVGPWSTTVACKAVSSISIVDASTINASQTVGFLAKDYSFVKGSDPTVYYILHGHKRPIPAENYTSLGGPANFDGDNFWRTSDDIVNMIPLGLPMGPKTTDADKVCPGDKMNVCWTNLTDATQPPTCSCN